MRQTFVSIIIISYLLTACGAPASAPTAIPTATNLPLTQAVTATSTQANTSTTIPALTATPAAGLTPTAIPAPAVIGLDNFSQLAQLHEYSADIEAATGTNRTDLYTEVSNGVYSPEAGTFLLPSVLPTVRPHYIFSMSQQETW
jgi:hypothetical protein